MTTDLTKFDPAAARNQAGDMLLKSTVLVVDDTESWYRAREMRRDSKLLLKTAEAHYKLVKAPMNEAIKKIREMEIKDCEPMEMVIENLDPKIIHFEEEEDRRRAELQAKMEEQARENAQTARDAELERLHAAGKTQEAMELYKRPLFIPPVILPPARDMLPGESRNETWYVEEETIDIIELAKAVVAGTLPSTAIEPSMKTLNGMAKAIKDSATLPGCEIKHKFGITQREV